MYVFTHNLTSISFARMYVYTRFELPTNKHTDIQTQANNTKPKTDKNDDVESNKLNLYKFIIQLHTYII